MVSSTPTTSCPRRGPAAQLDHGARSESTTPARTLVPPMSMPIVSGSHRLTRARRQARVEARLERSDTVTSTSAPGQVGGADEAGAVAEPGLADLEDRAVPAAGQLGLERGAHRRRAAGRRPRSRRRRSRRPPGRGPRSARRCPRPASGRASASCSMANGSPSRAASVISGPVIRSGSPPARSSSVWASSEPARAAARASRTRALPLAYCSKQPRLPQPHSRPSGHDAHVADLGADAEGAAEQLAVEHDAAADAGADGDQQQVVDVVAGAEGELAPGGGVRVVLDHHREVDPRLEVGLEVDVAPGDVGREHHRRRGPCRCSRPRRRRPRRSRGATRARSTSSSMASSIGLGVGRRRLDAELLDDRAVLVDDTAEDLGAADVDAAGTGVMGRPRSGSPSSGVVRVEVDVLHRGTPAGSAAPAAASSPAAACRKWTPRRRAAPHLRAGLAHGVHGPADRAVEALGVAGGDVLVDVAGPVTRSGRRPSRPARRAAWRPRRRRCRPVRPAGGVIRLAPSWPSWSRGRSSNETRSTPSSSTRAPATRSRARPAGRVSSRR